MQPDKYGPKTIESFEPLIWQQVRELVFDKSKWQDCVQEARIKVWEILRDNPEATREYIGVATKNRIREVSQYWMATGYDGQQGVPLDPLRRSDICLFGTDHDVRGKMLKVLGSLPEADEESGYRTRLASRVSDAVGRLSPAQQDYIHQRFYDRRDIREISRSGRCWYAPSGARAKLRQELKDLAA